MAKSASELKVALAAQMFTAEGQVRKAVAELRDAQSRIDADALDYGDKQKGEAADLIEMLWNLAKLGAEDLVA